MPPVPGCPASRPTDANGVARVPLGPGGSMGRGALIAVVASIMLVVSACTGSSSEGGVTPDDDRPAGLAPESPRPYEGLAADEPGGPAHVEALPARPSPEVLAAAAGETAGRLDAERFVILFCNALYDHVDELRTEEVERYLSSDAHPEAVAWVAVDPMLGTSVDSSTERPWIRSAALPGADGQTGFVVQVVVLMDVPALDNFRLWQMARVEVVVEDGEWRVRDLQPTIASEAEQFSDIMWSASPMDRGRDWRRFEIVGSP